MVTVSLVSLMVTFASNDIVVAVTLSKSKLRIVEQKCVSRHKKYCMLSELLDSC